MRNGGTWQDPQGREWPDEEPKDLQTLIMPQVHEELMLANERRLQEEKKVQKKENWVVFFVLAAIFAAVAVTVVFL